MESTPVANWQQHEFRTPAPPHRRRRSDNITCVVATATRGGPHLGARCSLPLIPFHGRFRRLRLRRYRWEDDGAGALSWEAVN